MTQYINLYDSALRPQHDLLSLRNVALAMTGTVLLLIGLAVHGILRTTDEQRNFQSVEARLRQAQEQVTVFAVQQGARKLDPVLQAHLQQAEKQLASRRAVLARLRAGEFGGQQGFSSIFRSLAEISVDGVWLTSVDALAAGQSMELRGRLLDEALLPAYVQHLAAHPIFAGRNFSALDVRRVSADKAPEGTASRLPYVEFILNGLPPELKESTARSAR